MTSRRRTRAALLEELYNEEQEDGRDGNENDTDDAVESDSSHGSETDADESDEDGESADRGGPSTRETPGAPARKRGRPAYLRSKSGHKWSFSAPKPRGRRSQLSYDPGPKGDSTNAKSPVEAWNCLFSDKILETIVKHTNEEIERRTRVTREREVNVDSSFRKVIDVMELRAIFGLWYYAGVHKMSKSNTINWWGTHGMPLFKATMRRDRFTFIVDCLRFDDRNTRAERKANDRFTNVREVWDVFVENCANNFQPGDNCTVGEQLLSFRGRCSFKMHVPSKPDKYGMKILCMNDTATHYMISAIPRCGPVNDKETGESVRSYYLRKLSEPIRNTGRNITCGNWFSSYPLFEKMRKEYNLTLVGAMKKNESEIPESFKKLPKNDPNSKSQFCYSDNKTLVSYNPRGKRIVLLLSSLHRTGVIDRQTGEPEIVLFYNKTKGGTDSFDQKCRQYTTARKTRRWSLRILYGMLDQASVNSFILYNLNENNASMKRVEFILRLSTELVKPSLKLRLATPTMRIKLRNLIEDFLDPLEVPEEHDIKHEFPENKMSKLRRCDLCHPILDRKTSYRCLRCRKPMCREHVAKICCECAE